MKGLRLLFGILVIVQLSGCGPNIEGTYISTQGNEETVLVFKPKGEITIHTGNRDTELNYKVEGTKITVTNPKKNKGYQVVNLLRILDDGSIRFLNGTRFSRQEK